MLAVDAYPDTHDRITGGLHKTFGRDSVSHRGGRFRRPCPQSFGLSVGVSRHLWAIPSRTACVDGPNTSSSASFPTGTVDNRSCQTTACLVFPLKRTTPFTSMPSQVDFLEEVVDGEALIESLYGPYDNGRLRNVSAHPLLDALSSSLSISPPLLPLPPSLSLPLYLSTSLSLYLCISLSLYLSTLYPSLLSVVKSTTAVRLCIVYFKRAGCVGLLPLDTLQLSLRERPDCTKYRSRTSAGFSHRRPKARRAELPGTPLLVDSVGRVRFSDGNLLS